MTNLSAPTETQSAADRPVVLVIEDDPTLNSALSYNLRREGYVPVSALDGEAGLVEFRKNVSAIQLVILDLMLPRMPGLHVLRNIRQLSSVPVLIVSARGQEQDKIDGLDLGADDYLVKPFALRELLARVRALIRRGDVTRQRMPTVIDRRPLRIDTAGRRVWVNDRELALRPKEYGLLLVLAVDADQVYSRQQLLDSVWGEDIIVDERTVDVHVSWLRGKLKRAGLDTDPIQTAYGSGYRFSTGAARSRDTTSESLRPGGGDVQASQGTRLASGS
jgi:two-component system response regulator RegX3